MPVEDQKALKQEARQRLESAPGDPKKMVFLHALILAAVSLTVFLINGFLDTRIESTSGLSGLQTRTMLASIQSLLSFIPTAFVMFWTMGYSYSILRAVRGKSSDISTLNEGFRRFGPILRYNILEYVVLSAAVMMCLVPSLMVFFSTPMGMKALEIADEGMKNGLATADGYLAPELQTQLVRAMLPMMAIYSVILGVVMWLVACPFRLAQFALMEEQKTGAVAAFLTSMQLMRGRWKQMLKLDLSFWWYYLLLALMQVLVVLDLVLPFVGVELPMSADAASLVFYVLGLAGTAVVSILLKNRVTSVYALFYDKLRNSQVMQEPAQEAPRPNPWNYQ